MVTIVLTWRKEKGEVYRTSSFKPTVKSALLIVIYTVAVKLNTLIWTMGLCSPSAAVPVLPSLGKVNLWCVCWPVSSWEWVNQLFFFYDKCKQPQGNRTILHINIRYNNNISTVLFRFLPEANDRNVFALVFIGLLYKQNMSWPIGQVLTKLSKSNPKMYISLTLEVNPIQNSHQIQLTVGNKHVCNYYSPLKK